jgi:crotonobetainyl-CoA:carnitine CoA-transferase CaiB-like acyl-CoA transferase
MMLEGLKVVEFATYIAAPGAGGLLSDWGADVIKVEALTGDPIRQFFSSIGHDTPENPVFDLDNRAKKSIQIDTSTPQGRGLMLKLIAEADIFLTNVRPAALARAGLDASALTAAFPRLIYAAVTGYGLTGPDADKPGFDVASFWSRSGWARLTAPKGTEPFPIRTGAGDHVCSLSTVSGILAALHYRNTTGKGAIVDASLLRAATYTLGSDLAVQMRFGRIASTPQRGKALNPLMNFFASADGRWLCVLPRTGNPDWPQIAAAFGVPDMPKDPRFASAKARRENSEALVAALDTAAATLTFDQLAHNLNAADIVWSPVQTAGELVADAQFIAAGGVAALPARDGGTRQSPSGPINFPGHDLTPRGPAPEPGEHTEQVLAALGLSANEIADLRANKIVA